MERNEREQQPLTSQLLQEVKEEESAGGAGGRPSDSAVTALLLFSIIIVACGSFIYGCATGYSSPVESEIMDDLGLSTAEYSVFGSVLTVGGMFGSLASGKISDLIGRRGAVGLSDILSLLGWIVISFSKEAWSLDVGRFLLGTAIGLLSYVVPVYIAEITPKNLRGGFISLSQLMVSSGTLVMYLAGSVLPWRILVLTGIIPSLVQLLGAFFIPESPRFLVKLGQSKAHEIVLQRLRGDSIDISQEAAEIEEFTEQLQQRPEVNFLGLFQRKYTRALIVVFGLMILAGFVVPNGVIYYASSVFESAGFSSSIGSIVMAAIQLPSTVVGAFLFDKCGRRPLLMFSAAAMGFCCFLVGLMFLLEEYECLKNISIYLIVVGIWGYSAAYPLGVGPVPYMMVSEILPMNVKASAGSLAIVVTCASSWAITYAFNFMTEWSFAGTFFILAGINAIVVLFAATLVPETKGRTLEELQESLGLS